MTDAQLLARYREALRDIACFGDTSAHRRLQALGSYALFDEPGSVEIALRALSAELTGTNPSTMPEANERSTPSQK